MGDSDIAQIAKSCALQPLATQNQAELQSNYSQLFQTLNLAQCKASYRSTPVAIGDDCESEDEGGVFTSSSSSSCNVVSGTATDKSFANCEGVNVLGQTYNKCVQDVKCLITQNKTEVTTETGENLTVNIGTGDGNVFINCGAQGLTINQVISGKVIIYTSISNKLKDQIVKSIVSNIQNAIPAIQQSSTGSKATYDPKEGNARNFQDVINQLNSQSLENNVSQSITDSLTKIEANETVNFGTGKGQTILEGNSCNINQDIHLNIIATNAVNTAFENAFKGQNLPALIGPPPYTPPPSKSSTLYIIIGIIVLLLVGVGIAYYYYYVRGKKKSPSESKNLLPQNEPQNPMLSNQFFFY